jgi:hypothetical protein
MAALHPTRVATPGELCPPSPESMDDATRDRFILKTIARVERIDQEMEVLLDKANDIEKVRESQEQMAKDLAAIRKLLSELLHHLAGESP